MAPDNDAVKSPGEALVPMWAASTLALLWFVVLSVTDLYFLAAIWPHPTPSGAIPQVTSTGPAAPTGPTGPTGPSGASDTSGAAGTSGSTTITTTTSTVTTTNLPAGPTGASGPTGCIDCSKIDKNDHDAAEECTCWQRVQELRIRYNQEEGKKILNDPSCVYIYGFGGWHLMWGETRLLIIVMLCGFLGAMIYSLRSFFWYVGNRKLVVSWLIMYALIPIVGSMMAVVFYLVLRGGLFSPATTVSDTSPFGFAAIAALVGMFMQQSAMKLKSVFEALMAKGETGSDHVPETPTPKAPKVSEVTAMAGTPGTVTIKGEGFTAESKVFNGKVELMTKTLDSAQKQLTVAIPQLNVGDEVSITVKNGDLSSSAMTAKAS